MFGKHKGSNDKKQYSVSQEDIAELQRYAHAKWTVEQTYRYSYMGFHQDQVSLMNNILAKLAINRDEFDIDWSTVFKDGKIFVTKKPKAQPKPEAIKEDAEQKLS